VQNEIQAAGGVAILLRGDIGQEDQLDTVFALAGKHLAPLHGLVANAAFGVTGPLLSTSRKAFGVTLHCSAWSLISLVQRAAPFMPHGEGSIVALSSRGAQEILAGYGLMGAAKAALENIIRTLDGELSPHGIRINGLVPEHVQTRSAGALKQSKTTAPTENSPAAQAIFQQTAAQILLLLSNQSIPTSGQIIRMTRD